MKCALSLSGAWRIIYTHQPLSPSLSPVPLALTALTARTDRSLSNHKRLIAVGKTQGDRIEVLDGINVGDKIILEGARSVKNNQEVKIAHKDQKVK